MDRNAKAETNGLAVASLIFGILSILTCWTLVLPVQFTLLAFMFALLSRGNKRECGVAKAGTAFAIIGLIFTVIIIVSILLWLWRLYTSVMSFVDMVNSYVEMIRSYVNSILDFFNSIGEFFENLRVNGIGGLLQ